MGYSISGYNTKPYLYRLTSLLPYDFLMAFHLFILNLKEILFLKGKSTQFTQLFLAMLDRFIELFHELFITPKKQLGHSYDIWRQWQLLTFLLCSCKSRLQQESHRFVKGGQKWACFPLCSSAGNVVKMSKAYYNGDKISCCRGFFILLWFIVSLLPDISFYFCIFWA